MKRVILLAFFCCISMFSIASNYKIDNTALDQIFASAEMVTYDLSAAQSFDAVQTADAATVPFSTAGGQATLASSKEPIVAFLLAWFLGTLGIHRFYMGTATLTGVGYILTLGGCGIVALIDWIMLLMGVIDKDISKYVNNPKFFMWTN